MTTMTGQEITIEKLRRPVYARRIKICLIVAAVTGLVSLTLIALLVGDVVDLWKSPFVFPLVILCPTIALSCVLSAISLKRFESKEQKVYESEIAALGGPDALMNEVRHETLYVLSRGNNPYTIITRRHIVEIGYHVYPIAGITEVHNVPFRSAFRMRFCYGGSNPYVWDFARVGILHDKEYTSIIQAIQYAGQNTVM